MATKWEMAQADVDRRFDELCESESGQLDGYDDCSNEGPSESEYREYVADRIEAVKHKLRRNNGRA